MSLPYDQFFFHEYAAVEGLARWIGRLRREGRAVMDHSVAWDLRDIADKSLLDLDRMLDASDAEGAEAVLIDLLPVAGWEALIEAAHLVMAGEHEHFSVTYNLLGPDDPGPSGRIDAAADAVEILGPFPDAAAASGGVLADADPTRSGQGAVSRLTASPRPTGIGTSAADRVRPLGVGPTPAPRGGGGSAGPHRQQGHGERQRRIGRLEHRDQGPDLGIARLIEAIADRQDPEGALARRHGKAVRLLRLEPARLLQAVEELIALRLGDHVEVLVVSHGGRPFLVNRVHGRAGCGRDRAVMTASSISPEDGRRIRGHLRNPGRLIAAQ